jgi:hypothetical protein
MTVQLDGPGRMKLVTLDDAVTHVQRLHGLVERMAATAQKNEPVSSAMQQFRRAGAPLVTLLKPQFGMIADHVAQMIVIAGRTGSDRIRVRALREGIGQLKLQVELAGNRVREVHAVRDDAPKPEASG